MELVEPIHFAQNISVDTFSATLSPILPTLPGYLEKPERFHNQSKKKSTSGDMSLV